jgi:hypothetical protein
MGGARSTYGDKRGVYSVYVGKPEVMRPLGKPRLRWEDNIKMDISGSRMESWTGLILLKIGTDGGHL